VVQNNLFKKTQLQTSFSGNMLAIGADGLQPQRFTLRGMLKAFIDFRFQTVRRRTAFELGKVRHYRLEHYTNLMIQCIASL
jgi:DNA gyrase subunit A